VVHRPGWDLGGHREEVHIHIKPEYVLNLKRSLCLLISIPTSRCK